MKYKLKRISGDASFREFYRLGKYNKTSIIVYAKKEKFKNLIVYAVVNKILNINKVNAPKLLSNHYMNNMVEISDLGEKSFYDYVILKKNKLNDYKSLVKLIIKIQKIKVKKSYKLGKFKVKFLKYTLNNLHKESDLFFDWYLKYCLKEKNISICNWPEGLEYLDFLIISCSLSDSSYHLIDSKSLPKTKQGVKIINVSRGSIINETIISWHSREKLSSTN